MWVDIIYPFIKYRILLQQVYKYIINQIMYTKNVWFYNNENLKIICILTEKLQL